MTIELTKTIEVSPVRLGVLLDQTVPVFIRIRVESESEPAARWVAEQFVTLVGVMGDRGR
jgi:hypothetical protein